MADLIRTKCGRILRREKHMPTQIALNSVFIEGYKKLFSPLVCKTCDFVQNLMGYHSEVFAYSKAPNSLNKMRHKMEIERQF